MLVDHIIYGERTQVDVESCRCIDYTCFCAKPDLYDINQKWYCATRKEYGCPKKPVTWDKFIEDLESETKRKAKTMNKKYILTTQDIKNLKKIKNKIKKDYDEIHIFFLSISSIVGYRLLNDHEPHFDKAVLVHFDEYGDEHIVYSLKQAAQLILQLEENCMHSDKVTTSFNEKESWIEITGLYPYTDLLYTLKGAADFIKERYRVDCELNHIKYERNTVENQFFFTEKDMQEYLLENGYENNPAFIIYSEKIVLSPEVESVIKLVANTNLKEVLTKQ